MTLLPQSRAVAPENNRSLTRAPRTFGHYPLNPNFVADYAKRHYMAKYLDA